MSSAKPSNPAGWFANRTRLVTIVSIGAVGLAGALAVGANVGLVHDASAEAAVDTSLPGVPTTEPVQVIDVFLPGAPAPAAASPTVVSGGAPIPVADPIAPGVGADGGVGADHDDADDNSGHGHGGDGHDDEHGDDADDNSGHGHGGDDGHDDDADDDRLDGGDDDD